MDPLSEAYSSMFSALASWGFRRRAQVRDRVWVPVNVTTRSGRTVLLDEALLGIEPFQERRFVDRQASWEATTLISDESVASRTETRRVPYRP
jgi:hypothetical protein